MSEQNQRLEGDNQPAQSKIIFPANKLIKRKLCQLQNKAFFFEGQLNPLIGQNQKLKVQLTLLHKSVTASTDLLRSLLPIGSSQTKRLKLELASIEQISEMIREDWHIMEDEISRKNFAIEVLQKKISSNQQEYESELVSIRQENEQIIEAKNVQLLEWQNTAKNAKQQLLRTKQKCVKEIAEIRQNFRLRIERAEKLQRDFDLYKLQVRDKYREYEKAGQRLKDEMTRNLAQFEQSKKHLKQLYDRLMEQKMGQQAQGFNMLLRSKEEQKDRMMAYFQEKELELQRCLNQKLHLVQRLEQQAARGKEQLVRRHSAIEQFKKAVGFLQKQVKDRESVIMGLRESNQLMEEKLKSIEGQFGEREKKYLGEIEEHQKRRQGMQSQLKGRIARLQKECAGLGEQLGEKCERLKQTEKSLATVERRFQQKLEHEQQRWSAEKLQLQLKCQDLKFIITQKQSLIEEKLSLIISMQAEHQQQIQLKQQQRARQVQQLKAGYQQEIELLKGSVGQQFAAIRKENERLLAEERIKNNQEMMKFQAQLNAKLTLKEEEFNNLKKDMQQQITNMLLELKAKEEQIQFLQDKSLQQQLELQNTKNRHQLQISKIREDSELALQELYKKSQLEKKKIQQQMISQLMQFQAEMEKKSLQYQNTLQKIQIEMMNEINMLKSSSALQEMEAKFLSQIDSLKKQHQQQLVSMEEKQKQSQQSLVEEQKRQIESLIRQYEEDMTRLAKKLESDIQNLNSELFVEQHEHEITKMTREQKIKYLSKKINELKIVSEQKENQILELQLQIQGYKSEQERVNQIIEQKVNQFKAELDVEKSEFMRECQASVQKSRVQAQRKVAEAQQDRLEYSQRMFEKFSQLKQLHEEELSRVQMKYLELERLFSERPSRAQDLSKIKELIEIKQKMDIEVKTCQKKVQHANEIVRYLNLELENYKDTYDMFGPNEQQSEKPFLVETSACQNPLQSIMKLKRINHRLNTEGTDVHSSFHKYEAVSPKMAGNLRIKNDSPSFREFQLYPGNPMNESQTLIPHEITSQTKFGHIRKNPEQAHRPRKGRSLDKSGQIVLNAQNFLKLINDSSKNHTPSIKEFKSNERRIYRKSKPRRINTLGLGNVDLYSIAGRHSIDQS